MAKSVRTLTYTDNTSFRGAPRTFWQHFPSSAGLWPPFSLEVVHAKCAVYSEDSPRSLRHLATGTRGTGSAPLACP
jgi:hypothetical protein